MAAVLASVLAVLCAALLILAAALALALYAQRRAADTAEARLDEADRDLAEARTDLRTAHRVERELRTELAVLRRQAEQRAVAEAALDPDALDPCWWSTAADIHALPTTDREMPR